MGKIAMPRPTAMVTGVENDKTSTITVAAAGSAMAAAPLEAHSKRTPLSR